MIGPCHGSSRNGPSTGCSGKAAGRCGRSRIFTALLTRTRLVTLPLWILGTDDVKQSIAGGADEDGNGVEYARGLSALAARHYPQAAALFAAAEQRGLRGATLRPLRVYALCMAQRFDEARDLARGVQPKDPDDVHFWSWLGEQFRVGPFLSR